MDECFSKLAMALDDYAPITLDEMKAVRLMNRTDTKYVISQQTLMDLLLFAHDHYSVQETNGERLIEYLTTYYDTNDMAMLRAHVSGRKKRQKVRIRTYVSSCLSFIEIKNKNNKGKTSKKRVVTTVLASKMLSDTSAKFIDSHANYLSASISPTITNSFRRITLVNKAMTERLTIDLGLSFFNHRNELSLSLPATVIVEVKRDGRSFSPIVEWLKARRIVSRGFSKYCYGALLTDSSLRCGLLRPKMRWLVKHGLVPRPQNVIVERAA